MEKKIGAFIVAAFLGVSLLEGCAPTSELKTANSNTESKDGVRDDTTVVKPTNQETQLEDGFSAVSFEGDYGFDDFLKQGGSSSDAQVIEFLQKYLVQNITGLDFPTGIFGCSTLSVSSPDGEALFGRNFDWQKSNALVVSTKPENGHTSISTVNIDFISANYNSFKRLPDEVRTIVSLYAPMDGMNEKGLSAAVLKIQDSATIAQNTDKPDVTTTTAIRLLLDKAANVEEAIDLLEQYDMHSSMGMMVHFALADAEGRSVVVEYVNNKMIVTETPIATNFYVAKGEKNGIGTAQSHTRFDILKERLNETSTMSMNEVRDALDSVSKENFGEFESTEWSIVYNQSTREVRYYHRENYEQSYTFFIE